MVWYAVKYVRKKDRKKKASSHQLCQLNSRECRSFKFRERERERERERRVKRRMLGPGAVSYFLPYDSKNYTQSLKCGISLLHDIRLTLTLVFPCLSLFVGFAGTLGIAVAFHFNFQKIGNSWEYIYYI
jgi:hypothetical protein